MNNFIDKSILHYHIIEKIGEGGMGIVYKAEDTRLKRDVAIKFLPHSFTVSEKEKQKLKTEAQIAAGLNHPNIATIYAIEEYADDTFIVMEYVKGAELKDIIRNSPERKIKLNDFLNYAIQITEGLNAAHKKGIIHRDIKSSNIMLSDDGRIRVMDFGLAQIHGDPLVTKKGSTPGTTAYMSPEQLRGEEGDFRSDLWSLGIVFYEMLTGQQPFQGNFDQAVIYSVLHEKPKSIKKVNPDISDELEQIVLHCLDKDRKKRIQSAEELLIKIKSIKDRSAISNTVEFSQRKFTISKVGFVVSTIIAAILIILAVFLPVKKIFNPENLQEVQSELQQLVNNEKYFEASLLVQEHNTLLENDSLFKALSLFIYDTLSVSSEPEGAKVYLLRYYPDKSETRIKGQYIGETPIKNFRIIRGDYFVSIEKDAEGVKTSRDDYLIAIKNFDYTPVKRIASSFPIIKVFPIPVRGINLKVKLIESDKHPKNMVFVSGGDYEIVSSSISSILKIKLDDFYIDEYEVSNADYKEFISAGGYSNKEFWEHHFIKDGTEISWNDAMKNFIDRTNFPGPRGWANQDYPKGKGNYPVTGISWYEAAAYATFIGKNLPTVCQWEKAARNGVPNYHSFSMPWGLIYPLDDSKNRSNFNSKETEPVNKYDFGISYYGCYNMAGNANEWCLNNSNDGFIFGGGSFEDSVYAFGLFKSRDGFYSSQSLGFRCVKNITSSESDQGEMQIDLRQQVPVYSPVSQSRFNRLLKFYDYEKKKLDPKIILKEENELWTKEKVSFNNPYGNIITGYLYLPKKVKQPFQCIIWTPHGGVYYLGASADWAAEVLFTENIKYGRALFVLVPKGSDERKWETGEYLPDVFSIVFRERVKQWVIENRIGIDYLASRGDIDSSKLAYVTTANFYEGLILPGVEKRFSTAILIATGIFNDKQQKIAAEINPINFLPRYNVQTFMLNGKYDEALHFYLSVMPVFNLLPEPKIMEAINTAHVPPLELRIPLINKWLDESLGQVEYEK